MSSLPGLEITGLRHRFGATRAVDGLDLSIAAGERVSVLGPSGCGKTTMLRLVAGLEAVQAGEIRIGGQIVADARRSLPPERRPVGLVFQDLALFPHLTVEENVAFGLHLLAAPERRARTVRLLERLGLTALAGRYPHSLSGGQQQRVALARALVRSPRVLLMDEPFSSLDQDLRTDVRRWTVDVLAEAGITAMLVTHDPDEACEAGDRVAVMSSGRLDQVAAPSTLYATPATPLVARLMGAAVELPGRIEDGAAHTALGTLPAPDGIAAGPAQVLIRPQGLSIARAGAEDIRRFRVLRQRDLGALMQIEVVPLVTGIEAGRVSLAVRGRNDVAEGDEVVVHVDPRHVLVFPGSPEPG